jgi:hypothetical protein
VGDHRDDKAIKYYLKATKLTDPVEVVDNKQLPMSEFEMRKLDRMGKVQKARYLKAREEKRAELIEQEKAKQERRIQDSHCRLFRLFLSQVCDTLFLHHSTFIRTIGAEPRRTCGSIREGFIWLTEGAKRV